MAGKQAFCKQQPHVHVNTRSIEAVLAPIAEQVSQLIVIDEQARKINAGLPDLTSAADAIDMAVSNLTQAGRDAVALGDEQLGHQMPVACEQVEAASMLFREASKGLRTDPKSEKARGSLIDAARGLLGGTTAILMAFDSFEVRKIVSLGDAVLEQLAATKTIASLDRLVTVIRSLSESLILLAELVDARHQELMNTSHRQRLAIANETLRKSSPLLVSALRTHLQNPTNTQAVASRDYAIGQLLTAVQEINGVVGSTDLDDNTYLEAPGAIAVLFERIQALLSRPFQDIDRAAVKGNVQQLVTHSATVAATCRSRPRVNEIIELGGKTQQQMEQFLHAAGTQTEDLRTTLYLLDQRVKDGILDELAGAFIQTDAPNAPISELMDALRLPAGDDIQSFIHIFSEHSQFLIRAARLTAAMSLDSKRVKVVELTTEQLEACAAQLVNAVQVARANPGSKAAAEHMSLLRSNWEHRVSILRSTLGAMTVAEKVVAVDYEAMGQHHHELRAAAQQGNLEALKIATAALMARSNHVLSVAETEVENSEDPQFREPLETAIGELRTAQDKTASTVASAGAGQANAAVNAHLDGATAELSSAVDRIRMVLRRDVGTVTQSTDAADLIDTAEDDEALEEAEAVAQNMQSSAANALDAETISRLLSSPTSVKAQPIMTAAKSLKEEAGRWSSRDNPVVSVATLMANHMTVMAQLSDKKTDGGFSNMIATAKNIASEAKALVQHAELVADHCSDKRMKADLLFLCDRLPTLSTQLKIIASVKAASTSDNESEADAMLVKNAQNLMDAVEKTVRACEAASLKQFSAVVSTKVIAIKWRKKIKK